MKYFIVLAFLVALLAWCPWLSKDDTLKLVDAKIAKMQEQNPNLCAMTIHKDTINKTLFGYTEKISYDCTVNDPTFGVQESYENVFVTFYRSVIGVPNATLKKNL